MKYGGYAWPRGISEASPAWILDSDSTASKVLLVARDQNQPVPVSCCSKLTVDGRKRHPLPIPLCFQLPPDVGHTDVEAQYAAMHGVAYSLQPFLKLRFPLSIRQSLNPTSELSNRDRADVEIALVLAQPLDHGAIWSALDRFTDDVRVNEIVHSLTDAVSSTSLSGISKGKGHASSRSTRPLFGGREIFCRTIVSSSWTLISKSSPGSKCRLSRTAAGRTIWPFFDITVVMVRLSYIFEIYRQQAQRNRVETRSLVSYHGRVSPSVERDRPEAMLPWAISYRRLRGFSKFKQVTPRPSLPCFLPRWNLA